MPPQQDSFSNEQNEQIDTVQLPPQPTTSERIARNPLLIPGAILLGALIIGISLIIGLSAGSGGGNLAAGAAGAEGETQAVNVKDVDIDGAPYIGNKNAPVTLVYWSDFQCPYCKAFEVGGVPAINTKIPTAMPDIIEKYVDTGKVKVVFKEFAFLGDDSVTAAEYSYAVWELYSKDFYSWRVAMMKAQDEEHGGFGDAPSIDDMIRTQFSQMDLSKIKQRIVAKKDQYATMIEADKAEGGKFGINGTPGFITGTKRIGGDAPFATFAAAIDPQLK